MIPRPMGCFNNRTLSQSDKSSCISEGNLEDGVCPFAIMRTRLYATLSIILPKGNLHELGSLHNQLRFSFQLRSSLCGVSSEVGESRHPLSGTARHPSAITQSRLLSGLVPIKCGSGQDRPPPLDHKLVRHTRSGRVRKSPLFASVGTWNRRKGGFQCLSTTNNETTK